MKAMWVTIGGLLLVSSGAAVLLPNGSDTDPARDRMNTFMSTPSGKPISDNARAAMTGTRFDPVLSTGAASANGTSTINRPTEAMRADSVRTSPLAQAPTNTARQPRNTRNTPNATTTTGTEYRSTRDRQMDRQRVIEDRQRQMEQRRQELAAQRELQARQRLGTTSATLASSTTSSTSQTATEGITTTGSATTGGTGTGGAGGAGGNTGGGSGSTGGGTAGGGSSGSGSGGGGSNSGGGGGGGRGGGSGGVGGGGTTGSNALNGRAVWLPVDNASCDSLENYRTADLFIRFNQSSSVLTVQSRAVTGLKIENGTFSQHPNGTNAPPTSAQIVANPCIAYDSYLAINEAGIVFTPPEPGALDWGSNLVGNWFSLGATPTIQDPTRFGDQGHYVHVARITAPAGETRVGGTLIISVRGATSTAISNVTVTVFNEPSLWSGDPPTTPPFPGANNPTGGNDDDDDGTNDGNNDGDDNDDTDNGNGGNDDGNGNDDGSDDGSGNGGNGGNGNGNDDDGDDDDNDDDNGGTTDDCPEWPDPYFDDIQGVTAVWVPVDNTENGCEALDGFATADLYLRMGAPNRVFTVSSDQIVAHDDSALVFTGPSPLQLAGGFNFQIPDDQLGANPCLAYDSWLMIGSVIPAFINPPNPSNWGARLDTVWFTTLTERAVQIPELFDDCAYYLRVARLTINRGPNSGAEGELRVGFSEPGSSTSQSAVVTIPNCPDCFADDATP